MKIITVPEEINEPFLEMVPDFVLEGKTWLIGCVDEEEIVSVAVVGVDEPELELRWLYTDEPQRNRGGAKMIMEYLIQICDKHGFRISFVFENNKDYTPVMLTLCQPLLYDFSNLRVNEYSTTKDYVKDTEFYKKYKPKPLNGFVRLIDARQKQLYKLVDEGIVEKYDIDHLEYKYSYLLEKDDEIVAAVLTERNKFVPEDLLLSYIYIKEKYEVLGINFLRSVIEDVFSKADEYKTISFQTINDQMDEIVKKILDTEPDDIRYFYKAEYNAVDFIKE